MNRADIARSVSSWVGFRPVRRECLVELVREALYPFRHRSEDLIGPREVPLQLNLEEKQIGRRGFGCLEVFGTHPREALHS